LAPITKGEIFISQPLTNIEVSNLKKQILNPKVLEDAEENHVARRQGSQFKTER